MTTITVTVTLDTIEAYLAGLEDGASAGQIKACTACPVARAIRASAGKRCLVSYYDFEFETGPRHDFGQDVTRFIRSVDDESGPSITRERALELLQTARANA